MRTLLTLLVSLLCLLPLCSTAAFYDEGALENLFNTPEQRQKIDAFRKGKSVGVAREQISPTDVKVQGIMMRSGGPSTVWVNGKSTLEGNRVGGVDVKLNSLNKKSDQVTVNINNKAVRLKPGQVWSEDSGQISDSY